MDWKSAIASLQGRGLTQPQIAAWCGCGQSTISELAVGRTKDPRDSTGQALRSLLELSSKPEFDPSEIAARVAG